MNLLHCNLATVFHDLAILTTSLLLNLNYKNCTLLTTVTHIHIVSVHIYKFGYLKLSFSFLRKAIAVSGSLALQCSWTVFSLKGRERYILALQYNRIIYLTLMKGLKERSSLIVDGMVGSLLLRFSYKIMLLNFTGAGRGYFTS